MNLEEQVQAAIARELGRQAAESGGALEVSPLEDDAVTVRGTLDLAAISMAIVGAVAGGP